VISVQDEELFGEDQAYGSPEEAAVASFPAAARPKVNSTTPKGADDAIVHLILDPGYDYYVYAHRASNGWVEVHGTI
jgi:hypothetical protein